MIRIALALVLSVFAIGCDSAASFQGDPSLAIETADATTNASDGSGGGKDAVANNKDAGSNVCVPNCTGRECGNDGCGGQCGACGPTEFCNSQTWSCETPPLQTVDAVVGTDASAETDVFAETDVAVATTDVVVGVDIPAQTDATASVDTQNTTAGTDAVPETDVVASTTDVVVGTDAVAATDTVAETDAAPAATDVEAGTDAAAQTDTGAQSDTQTKKPLVCTIKSTSGKDFTFYGSGVSALTLAKSGWSFPMASANQELMFSTGDMPFVSFNVNLGSEWGYGANYAGGFTLNGNWLIDCEGVAVTLLQGVYSKATCDNTLEVGKSCLWSEGNDHRIVVRLW